MTQKTWLSTDQPNLLLNSESGRYYARYTIANRRTFKALGTQKLAVAKQRLRELLSDVDKSRAALAIGVAPEALRMGQLVAQDLLASEADTNIAPATKLSHGVYFKRIQKTWPGFDNLKPSAITVPAVREWVNSLSVAKHKAPWGKKMKVGYSASAINHSLDKLAALLNRAVGKGALLVNPLTIEVVRELRRKIVSRVPDLPARGDMEKVFLEMGKCPTRLEPRYISIQTALDNQAADASEFARFLAYSGARQKEGAAVMWEDINAETMIIRGTKTETSRYRVVPQISSMKNLILSIRTRRLASGLPLTGKVFAIQECQKNLTRSCSAVGVKRLVHHDLRHYFATICIESGVDIPTVSKWLGHADGGALCMKTYGHLRQEHSIAAAVKVVA